jgi:transcriptional regulator with XRE-family HTH domain
MIGDEIKKIRKAADLSQAALAELLGVKQAVISKWERGFSKPLYQNLLKLSDLAKQYKVKVILI